MFINNKCYNNESHNNNEIIIYWDINVLAIISLIKIPIEQNINICRWYLLNNEKWTSATTNWEQMYTLLLVDDWKGHMIAYSRV